MSLTRVVAHQPPACLPQNLAPQACHRQLLYCLARALSRLNETSANLLQSFPSLLHRNRGPPYRPSILTAPFQRPLLSTMSGSHKSTTLTALPSGLQSRQNMDMTRIHLRSRTLGGGDLACRVHLLAWTSTPLLRHALPPMAGLHLTGKGNYPLRPRAGPMPPAYRRCSALTPLHEVQMRENWSEGLRRDEWLRLPGQRGSIGQAGEDIRGT
jgi:hypothetical protein